MCRLFKITGRVQGVFFRVSTRDVAVPLGLTGHAINLPDGSVEVRACGAPDNTAKLHDWLQDGPPHARVDAVDELPADCEDPDRFNVG